MSGAAVVATFACLRSQAPLVLRPTITHQPAGAWIASTLQMVPPFLLWRLPRPLELLIQAPHPPVLHPPAPPIRTLGQEQTGVPVLLLTRLRAPNMDRRIRPSAPVETY
jgi:hypothetical protein